MIKTLIALSSLIVTLTSCTPSTPQARIQQDPVGFTKLTSKHQQLAEQGRIEKGMPQKAVYYAWGQPSGKIAGSRNGIDFQRWNYSTLTPVYNSSIYSNFGYGFGRRHYRGPYSAIGYAPQINYVPRHSASVEFKNDKVTNWERRQR